MKNFWISLFNMLSSTQKKIQSIKLFVLASLFFIGCIWQPFFVVVTIITALFIICEHNINSISYNLFFVSLLSLFTFKNDFGLNFWFLLVCVFVLTNGLVMLINIIKRKEKLNVVLLIFFLILTVYFSIPFSSKYDFKSVLESYVWLAMFYIILSHIKDISLKKQTLVASFGFVFSGVVGLFRNIIPYLKNNIYLASGGGLLRFSGAMNNPNLYYCCGLMCLALLIVLMLNKKLSLWYSLLFGLILMLCFVTLSKTFLIIFLVILLVTIVLMFLNKNPIKLKIGVVVLLSSILVCGIFFNYTKAYYNRFFNAEEITPSYTESANGSSDINIDLDADIIEDNTPTDVVVNTLTTGRFEIWKLYFMDLLNSGKWLTGFGINTAQGLIGENSHSTYLQMIYEVGFLGVLIIVGLFVYYIIRSISKTTEIINSGCFLPFMVLLGVCLTENFFLSQMGNMLLLLALFGMLIVEPNSYDNIEKREVLYLQKDEIIGNKSDFKLAILTPAYNRAELLKRTYDSLKNQTNKSFVWYIIDDGSSDNTEEVVNGFINENTKNNDFKIFYTKKENGGKHTALNVGIKQIQEPFTIILDSDDYLTVDAIETIINDSSKILDEKFCGLGYLKEKTTGEVVGKLYTNDIIEDTFVNQRYNKNTYGDKAEVFKTEVLKQFPFPEFDGEKFLSEATVWCAMSGKYKMLFINKAIYVCEYQEGGLSDGVHKRLFKNPKGAVACYKELTTSQFNFLIKTKHLLLYILYAYACGYSVKQIIKNSYNKILTTVLLPFSYLLYLIKKRRFS